MDGSVGYASHFLPNLIKRKTPSNWSRPTGVLTERVQPVTCRSTFLSQCVGRLPSWPHE